MIKSIEKARNEWPVILLKDKTILEFPVIAAGNSITIETEDDVTNHGIILAPKSITIETPKSIICPGLLISDNITLEADIITLSGTIICNGACTIKSHTPVDPDSFCRLGAGIFTINDKSYFETIRYTTSTGAPLNKEDLTFLFAHRFIPYFKKHSDNAPEKK